MRITIIRLLAAILVGASGFAPAHAAGPSGPGILLPAFIAGEIDLTSYSGVRRGVLSTAARTANGVALQAALDDADTNGKCLRVPAGRFEYIATGVQNGRNAGLQVKKGVRCLIGAGSISGGTMFVNYATNHPALTLGDIGLSSAGYTYGGRYGGFAVGHGVSQTGQASADGLLVGNYYNSYFDDILVTPFGDGFNHANVGLEVGTSLSNFFFQNVIGAVTVKSGSVNGLKWNANGTGNSWRSLYVGAGTAGAATYGSRQAFSSYPVWFNTPGAEIGSFDQLNIEWSITGANLALLRNDSLGLKVQYMHLEGDQLSGFNAGVLHGVIGRTKIDMLRMLDVYIASAGGATGTPRILSSYGDSRFTIDQLYVTWAGAGANAEAVASIPFVLYADDATIVGRKPFVNVGSFDINGNTGAFSLDANTAGTAPGTNGAISGFESYRFNKARSQTEGASIEMANANLTVYGQHRRAKVRVTTALTAARSLTLAGTVASAAPGLASSRAAGDIVEVHRIGAGAFDLTVLAHDGTTVLYTFSGSASAGTAKSFEWSGSAWTVL
ncbi:hypothetical protein [Methylobacterium longum]|uniref:Pectate lyase superfamily protein domain-containing protein n=1 Tax=Methylobacterium longum TaxID=767694 RepID=A0ABT8AQ33_9HYPH|nr:hypothetical protein [Methylobacterium longum]MDN3571812.1 hypothetical protein [Methylobacterium longum]GJE14013.1 hypothetical protein FOHLNKBM_5082 [Methylobacterium longum]